MTDPLKHQNDLLISERKALITKHDKAVEIAQSFQKLFQQVEPEMVKQTEEANIMKICLVNCLTEFMTVTETGKCASINLPNQKAMENIITDIKGILDIVGPPVKLIPAEVPANAEEKPKNKPIKLFGV